MLRPVQILRYSYNGSTGHFTMEQDVYEGWVILAAQSGKFWFRLEGEHELVEDTAEFGELVICPPGSVLMRRALEPITFHFMELSAEGTWQPGKVRIRDAGRLQSSFSYLQKVNAEGRNESTKEEVEHLIGDLLFLINREKKQAAQQRKGKSDTLMPQAAAYIEQMACGPDMSMQTLAKRLGISLSQLSKRFQAFFGVSPVEYATTVRLAKARLLLIDTDETLEAIADQCGYRNAFYFSRIFTRQQQINPSVYRRQYRV